jgi:hypothetical protein
MAGRIKRPAFLLHIPEFFVWLPLSPFVFHMHEVRTPRSCSSIFGTVVSPIMTRLGLSAYGKIFDELW